MSNANTSGAIARITREIAAAQKNGDLSISVACRDSDIRVIRALIIGPPETPYEFGFFEFQMKFPHDYPIKSPNVKCITNNGGKCRFNPNIYANGKVCLSILGTWRGEPSEEWSSAQGLESVLLSIQSLMSPNPYENEPGFEDCKKSEAQPSAYIAKIRHESLRISVLQRLEAMFDIKIDNPEPPSKKVMTSLKHAPENVLVAQHLEVNGAASGSSHSAKEGSVYEYNADAALKAAELAQWDPFADLMKRRFLWYYDTYMQAIETYSHDQPDGTQFKRTEFEGRSNMMQGQFDYSALKSRVEVVRRKIEEETSGWLVAGAAQVLDGTQLAVQLAFQFEQLQQQWNTGQRSGSKIELSLPTPNNPFWWNICLFGEPMTNLDGGIFNIKLLIPPDFPESQPRVSFETAIFHHRVSRQGMLCYFPEKEDDLGSHLDAIQAAVDDKDAKYDPRAMVNPPAFALYWGGDEQRKIYNRNLRRTAQESSELL